MEQLTPPENMDVSEVVTNILLKRGLKQEEITAFLSPDYDRDLHDPYLMTDMDKAVTRILTAAKAGQKVVVYGDYDIDGITASAVLLEGLAAQDIMATSYIPDRFEEGYGLNQSALEQLKADGAQLVISVDCGITSIIEANWAREHGLDLIITDHHNVPETLPKAIAVINPKRPDDKYPFKDLAGVGVAFKLIQALQQKTGRPPIGQEKWLLDLVALGTICDVVDLVGENRVLVSFGLKVLRQTPRLGLRALASVTGVELGRLRAENVAFAFGPRLNAAGRLEHARSGLELLQTSDSARAAQLAAKLDQLNQQRRVDQQVIVEGALEQATTYPDDQILVLASPDWNHGIVGIAAARVMEETGRPTIILQIMGDTAKGSARSNGSFNMVDGLRAVSQHLQRFGGHFYAAGCSLPTNNIEAFRRDLNTYFSDSGSQCAGPVGVQVAELTAYPSQELYQALEKLEPYGAGNRQPALRVDGLILKEVRSVGADSSHLKFSFGLGSGYLNGIGFGLAKRFGGLQTGTKVSALGYLDENYFRGSATLQLRVLELESP